MGNKESKPVTEQEVLTAIKRARFTDVLDLVETDPEVKLVALVGDNADFVKAAMRLCNPERDVTTLAQLVDERVVRKVIGPACPPDDAPEYATCQCKLVAADRSIVLRDVYLLWLNPLMLIQFA